MTVLLTVVPIRSGSPGAGEYDAWLDWNDDGEIDIKDVSRVARAFGTSGQNVSKASLMYDSGWLDLRNETGETYTITHNLNDIELQVDARKITSGWNMTYGGTGEDFAYALVQTGDGGYALAGNTASFGVGGDDFWLIKTNATGNMQWNKTHGGTSDDGASALVQTGDGGYALAGWTTSFGAGDYDFWLIKTDADGNAQWNKTYGGTAQDWVGALVQTADGGYALTGSTYSFGAGQNDFWLVKTDELGNMQSNQTYGGTNGETAYGLVQTGDGGYALAGNTASFGVGGDDFWLIKTDAAGNAQWNRTYGGTNDDYAYGLVQTSDGGYAIAGVTGSYSVGFFDFWLVKTNSTGGMEWNQTFGETGNDRAFSVVQTSDGGYALAGSTDSSGSGLADFYLVKARSCTLNITIQAPGGTTDPSPGAYSYSVGTVVTVNATPYSNYFFFYWLLDGVFNVTNPISVPMNANRSLRAFFIPSYTLTLNATAGGTTSPSFGTYIYSNGTIVNVTAFPNTGYYLGYWELDGVPNVTNPISVTMNANRTLTAFFRLIPYSLTITVTAGGTTSPSGTCIYSYGTVVNVTASPNIGSYFDHWELDGVNLGGANPINMTMNKDYRLHAVFESGPSPTFYTLTLNATAGGTTSPSSGTYIYSNGTIVNVTASPDTFHILGHWELDGNNTGATNPMNVTMNTDRTLYAVFIPHHDVAVTNATSPKTVVGQGFNCSINVTVENQGSYTETINVTVYANNTATGNTTSIATFNNVILTFGASWSPTLYWNTAGFAKGNYTISAYAEPVPGETDPADNNFTSGLVTVAMVGDITGPDGWPDGDCDIRDVSAVARLFGVNSPDPKYKPNFDINGDGDIDIKDVSTVARHYGEHV